MLQTHPYKYNNSDLKCINFSTLIQSLLNSLVILLSTTSYFFLTIKPHVQYYLYFSKVKIKTVLKNQQLGLKMHKTSAVHFLYLSRSYGKGNKLNLLTQFIGNYRFLKWWNIVFFNQCRDQTLHQRSRNLVTDPKI